MHSSVFQRQIKLLFRRIFMNWGGFISRESMITIKCREILSFLPLPMLCYDNTVKLKMEIALFCTEPLFVFSRQREYVKMLWEK